MLTKRLYLVEIVEGRQVTVMGKAWDNYRRAQEEARIERRVNWYGYKKAGLPQPKVRIVRFVRED